MKLFIQFLVIVATLAGMVVLAFFFKSTDEGDFSASVFYGVLTLLITSALITLFRWDKKRDRDEEIELRQCVGIRVNMALNNKQPVEFYAKPSLFITLAFILILSLGAIYFGVYLLIGLPLQNRLTGLMFLIGGLFFCIALAESAKRLIGHPVIRLDKHGLMHFRFGFIPWSDVNEICPLILNIKGNLSAWLEIGTINNAFYLARIPRWLRIFRKSKTGKPLLFLPLSEEDARVACDIAKAYADFAGAPLRENIFSTKLAMELSRLQTSQQKIGRLQTLMTESSENFIKQRQAISKTYFVSNVFVILGVIAICFAAWVTSK
ncbi:hypothetical protein [Methylomonas rivi]|uniref:Uncharacterized protein n=1 Tax=Methylomonas rivi TaxID=2952226 RepID=A0ABT1U995_9GAMM|nr:hypothetical protein [Methylomonas sp. WSC-6]MCQ8130439.1 hypothetical protein [Methylomonas sp. WSC-6]